MQNQKTTHPVTAILTLIVIPGPLVLVAAVCVVGCWIDPSARTGAVIGGLVSGGFATYVTVRLVNSTDWRAAPIVRVISHVLLGLLALLAAAMGLVWLMTH